MSHFHFTTDKANSIKLNKCSKTPKMGREIEVVSFIISMLAYIALGPIILLIFLINEVVRLAVEVYLHFKYNGQISLVKDGMEAAWTLKRHGFTRMILASLKLKDDVQADTVVEWLNKLVVYKDSNGTRLYEKLEYILTARYGYACWKRDIQFDVKNHCRSLNPSIVHTESEMKKIYQQLSQDMDENRPQWELLIVPKYKESGEAEVSTRVVIRCQHSYADGLSVIMLLKNVMTSNFTYYLDPCEFKIPSWRKALIYTNAVLHGPYSIFKAYLSLFEPIWPLLQLSNEEVIERNYTWTKGISMDTIKKIRQTSHNCSISSVIVNAFISSAIEVLPKKRIPEVLYIGEVAALLPYPDQKLQNRFSAFRFAINSFDEDFIRLKKSKKDAYNAMVGPYIPTMYAALKFLGRLPVAVHGYFLKGKFTSLVCSNVPFSKTNTTFFDTNELLEIQAYPPQPNDIGITIFITAYQNNLTVCASGVSNCLRREELEQILKKLPNVIDNWYRTAVTMHPSAKKSM